MKKFGCIAMLICLLLAAGLPLAGCAADSGRIVVGRVGSENITAGEVTRYANYMVLSSGYKRSDLAAADIAGLNEGALDNAVTYRLICQKAASLGLYPLSAESRKTADDNFNAAMARFQASGTSIASAGLNEGDLRALMTVFEASDVLKAETTKDVTVSDGDIQTEYDRLLAEQQPSYTADPSAYETALSGGVINVVYRPAGYRYVKHILIAMPADIASQIQTATSGGDTGSLASLRKQGLEQIKDKAAEVLAKVKNGGDFDALMAQYGEDPGMTAEPAKTSGYQVGVATSFVPEFLKAALGLARPGDTTDLVASDFGYHIIKYVSDAPSGPIPLEEVKDNIRASLLAGKQTDAFNALIEQWKKETTVKRNPKKMPVG